MLFVELFPVKVRLGCKSLTLTNTLAYFRHSVSDEVKRFYYTDTKVTTHLLHSVVNVIKLFTAVSYDFS